MKKAYATLLLFITSSFLLFGCQQANVEQLSNGTNSDKLNEENRYIPLPSNKEQNREKKEQNDKVKVYANEYENFLNQLSLQYEDVKKLFDQTQPSQKEVNKARKNVQKMQQLIEEMDQTNAPKPFQDLQQFHKTLLVELQMLDDALQKYNANDEKNVRLSRVYFENILSYQDSMLLEYRLTVSELGIY